MQSSLKIYRIKQGKEIEVKDLVHSLKEGMRESLETLEEAGIFIESIFVEDSKIYVYKLCKDIEAMNCAQLNSQHKLYEIVKPILNNYMETEITLINGTDFIRMN